MPNSTLDRIQPGTQWKSRVTGIECEIIRIKYSDDGKKKIHLVTGGLATAVSPEEFLQRYEPK